jgi:two-component system, NarL family, response regulator LiaR
VKLILRDVSPRELKPAGTSSCRKLYFFQDRETGASHFQIEADSRGRLPVDEAAGRLAMQCMVRGQSPEDYIVTIRAAQKALQGLVSKTESLMQAGYSVAGVTVKLTLREGEVLGGIIHSMVNKEIAASLNVSVRTVKFHVSSLLAKYGVHTRMELAREITRRSPSMMPVPKSFAIPNASSMRPEISLNQSARHVGLIALAKCHLTPDGYQNP